MSNIHDFVRSLRSYSGKRDKIVARNKELVVKRTKETKGKDNMAKLDQSLEKRICVGIGTIEDTNIQLTQVLIQYITHQNISSPAKS